MAVLKYRDPETGEVKTVGAPAPDYYTKEEQDAKLEEKAALTHAEQHAAGGSDEITPEMIGAAPAGFGLGGVENVPLLRVSSLDELKEKLDETLIDMADLTYRAVGIVQSVIVVFGGANCIAEINKSSVSTATVYMHHNGVTIQLVKNNGVWRDIEWVDSILEPNKEYRTAERINYKHVYKRLVNGVVEYRLDGETEWKAYADAVGAVSKSGDIMTDDLGFNDDYGHIIANSSLAQYEARSAPGDRNNRRGIRIYNPATTPSDGDAVRVVTVKNGNETSHAIFHEGNKPSGTYTGNGDATQREVVVGGTGTLLYVYGNNSGAVFLMTPCGTFFRKIGTQTVSFEWHENAKFTQGKIFLKTASDSLNKSGETYTYRLL